MPVALQSSEHQGLHMAPPRIDMWQKLCWDGARTWRDAVMEGVLTGGTALRAWPMRHRIAGEAPFRR